jgi:hypothetical protein
MSTHEMINTSQKMLEHSAIVLEGSGVFIQPNSNDYSYILTAKHVIETATGSKEYLLPEKITVHNHEGVSVPVLDTLIDNNKDIAILIVDKVANLSLIKSVVALQKEQKVYILGFPKTRRELEEKTREFVGEFTKVLKDIQSVRLVDIPDIDQLKGVSGGGLFCESNNDVYLTGIQFKVEGNPTGEHHGIVQCVPIESFDHLINSESNTKGYASLYPLHLNCFSYLIEDIFNFKVGNHEHVLFLCDLLKFHAKKLIKQNLPKPLSIYESYNQILLLDKSDIQDGLRIELWTAYLEYIVITSIVDDIYPIEESQLGVCINKRRMIYTSEEENWTLLLQRILSTDLSGLSENGIVFISSGSFTGTYTPSDKTLSGALSGVVTDISRPPSIRKAIDAGIKHPAQTYKYFHWDGLHSRCVVENEDEIAEYQNNKVGYDAPALLELIKDKYHEFIN